MVRDAFPLPCIDEALQAVHNCQWFSSFDLAQGYLQMPVDEADIHKTAFWAGSSGLYEFTRMPFGLANLGSSFCCLMEMCLWDQQFVTLLLYLDDIFIFAANVNEMLDQIEMVFGRLKDFNLKIKPKKWHFFNAVWCFWDMSYLQMASLLTQKRWKKCKIGQFHPTRKSSIHFWAWPLVIGALFQSLLQFQNVFMNW